MARTHFTVPLKMFETTSKEVDYSAGGAKKPFTPAEVKQLFNHVLGARETPALQKKGHQNGTISEDTRNQIVDVNFDHPSQRYFVQYRFVRLLLDCWAACFTDRFNSWN
eukprot:4210551-Amphidinium_carterae.1